MTAVNYQNPFIRLMTKHHIASGRGHGQRGRGSWSTLLLYFMHNSQLSMAGSRQQQSRLQIAKAKAQQKQKHSNSKSKSTFWPANYFHLVAELVSVGSGQDYVAFVFRPTKIAFDWHDGCCCLESRRQAFGAMI